MEVAAEIGEELGRGVRSVVYALGHDDVVKVPVDGTPDAWLTEELRIADSAARAGAPVPGRRRIVSVAGRPALVSERVLGPSMADVLADRPERAAELGRLLADLQRRVWRCTPSYELPLQWDRLEAKIHVAARRLGDDLLTALELVDRDDVPLVLCHGDLHPRNVLLASSGALLVDWFDASRGAPAADVARTELVLAAGPLVPGDAGPTRAYEVAASSYRDAIAADRAFDPESLARWRVVQAIARLAEGFGRPDEARRDLRAVIGR